MRLIDDETFCEKHQISIGELHQKISNWKNILNNVREKRIRPHRDEKILTSWNALVIKGLCDAYQATNNNSFLQLAEDAIYFILDKQWKGSHRKAVL